MAEHSGKLIGADIFFPSMSVNMDRGEDATISSILFLPTRNSRLTERSRQIAVLLENVSYLAFAYLSHRGFPDKDSRRYRIECHIQLIDIFHSENLVTRCILSCISVEEQPDIFI